MASGREGEHKKAVLSLGMIIERKMNENKEIFLTFVDREKDFDSVKWDVMFEILKKISIKFRD